MSFCSRLIYFNPNKSLPKYRKANCCKKAFLHISSKASYTLEMAVVLPLVAAFFVSILFFFRVLQVQTQVQAALNYASRKTAVQACVNDVPSPLLATAEVYFRKELKQYAEYQKYVAGRKTLDYVIMFIPNYGAYQLAKMEDKDIFAKAFRQNVLIVFYSLLVQTTAKALLDNPVNLQIRISADRRRKMTVTIGGQSEMPRIFHRISRLFHRTQRKTADQSLLLCSLDLL